MATGQSSKKCVVVGDGAVGKTCMLITFTCGSFPTEYIPTVFDNYATDINMANTVYQLSLWDTAGQDDYDRLRPLSYPDTDVVLFCFSVVSPRTFENVLAKWHPEVTHHMPGVPTILVGLQSDLRANQNVLERLALKGMKPVTADEARAMAKRVQAECYMECSALLNRGVKELFQKMMEATKSKPKRSKSILKISFRKMFKGKREREVSMPKIEETGGSAQTASSEVVPKDNEVTSPTPKEKSSDAASLASTQSTGEITIIDHQKLTLLDMVGRGGFGAVFRGKWVDRKNEVFGVKKCTIGGTQRDPSIPREVDILSTVSDHNHIIAFYGVAFNYPDMFIVTEFAEKGSLYTYLHKDKHNPSRDQSLTWALQVARGMHHLHCHDVIHRDLKSANILLSATMDVKLCDFGTARYLPHTTIQTGEAGTYRWMAPEIMEGIDAKISKKCDLFSFAMVAYELLVHKLPYHDTPGDPYVAIKVVKGERPMIPPFVPVYLSALLVECWDADPQKRPSFQYVIDLLSQYI